MKTIFQNPGLIDLLGVRTFGVSAKVSDTPIGFFGTGLKYAIAVVLRHGGKITLWRGTETYKFSTEPAESRGSEFHIVTMNGERLGFTTALGKTWEMWQAFRELHCNVLDEHGRTFETDGAPVGMADTTTIVVDCREMSDAYAMRDTIMLTGDAVFATSRMRILNRPSPYVYYRGIRIGELARPCVLTYDGVMKFDLTEDRTLKDSYSFAYYAADAVLRCTDEETIERALTAEKGTFEHDVEYPEGATPSDAFMAVVGRLRKDFTRPVNRSALRFREEIDLARLADNRHEQDPRTATMLDRAIYFLQRIGMDPAEYPIVVVDSLGPNVLGRAYKSKIYVSRLAFDKGVKSVVGTLFEEWAHLKHGIRDETYGMQNFLIDKLIEQAEHRLAEYL